MPRGAQQPRLAAVKKQDGGGDDHGVIRGAPRGAAAEHRERRRGLGGGEEVLVWGKLHRTEPRWNSREQGGEVMLLTDVPAARGGSWGAWRAGPGPAHLSLPFWMEAWPRLALSKSGEFLLRFVLVERTLFCGDKGQDCVTQKPERSIGGLSKPVSLLPSTTRGKGRKKGFAFTLGGGALGFLQ